MGNDPFVGRIDRDGRSPSSTSREPARTALFTVSIRPSSEGSAGFLRSLIPAAPQRWWWAQKTAQLLPKVAGSLLESVNVKQDSVTDKLGRAASRWPVTCTGAEKSRHEPCATDPGDDAELRTRRSTSTHSKFAKAQRVGSRRFKTLDPDMLRRCARAPSAESASPATCSRVRPGGQGRQLQ